jgi:hypothetical protein
MRILSIPIRCFLMLFILLGCGPDEEPLTTNPFDPMNLETQGDPFNLKVQLTEKGSALLTWDELQGVPFDFYRIRRQVADRKDNPQVEPEKQLADVPLTAARQHEDTDIVAGRRYTYWVNAVRGAEESERSIGVTISLNAAPTVTIHEPEFEGGTVTLKWTGADDRAVTGYAWRLDGQPWTDFVPNETEHTFHELEAGKHTVQVRATDDEGLIGPIRLRAFKVPPMILSTEPLDGATDVPLTIDVEIRFNAAMDEDSVMNAAFKLIDLDNNEMFKTTLRELVDVGLVDVEFSEDRKILSATSTKKFTLEPNRRYKVEMEQIEVTDVNGERLIVDKLDFTFQTGDE